MPRLIGLGLSLFFLSTLTLSGREKPRPATSPVEPARTAKLRDLLAKAQQAADRLSDYRVRLRRREIIGGKRGVEDILMLTIRSKPFSVHVKCLPGSENEGREMLYVAAKPEDMHVLTGKGDVLAGMRMDVSIRSEMVTANSRRSIDEAGFAYALQKLGLAVDRYLTGQPASGEFEPLGLQTRSESRAPMEVVLQHIPANQEPLMPHGGKRYWHFNADPDSAERFLPTLLVTFDEKGQEVEYYYHDRLLPRVNLENHDFDADQLWSRK